MYVSSCMQSVSQCAVYGFLVVFNNAVDLVASTTGFILAPTAVAQTACKRQPQRRF